jgi:hypothetical protein
VRLSAATIYKYLAGVASAVAGHHVKAVTSANCYHGGDVVSMTCSDVCYNMSCNSGSYLKREGRPRDDDVLVARLVDRPLRPMFEKGWCNETQVCHMTFYECVKPITLKEA